MVYLDILAYVILAVIYVLVCFPFIGGVLLPSGTSYIEALIVGFYVHFIIVGVTVIFGAVFWAVDHLWGS